MSQSTHVLFVAHDSLMFGAQRTLLTLLQHIDRKRFSCHVAVPYEAEFTDHVRRLDIGVHLRHMVHWVPGIHEASRAGRYSCLRRLCAGVKQRAWALATLIQKHNIDVVYTNTVTVIEGAIAARMTSRPHLWHIHEPIRGNPELAGLAPQLFYEAAIRALSTHVVFPSESLARAYALLKSRSTIVHNGLPVPGPFDRDEAGIKLRHALGLSPRTKLIVTVGAIQPRKDHLTFVRAAELVAAACPDATFVIVGSGDERLLRTIRSELHSRGIADKTHVTGWWPGPIHDVLAAADVLVISSIQESFALTGIEALSVETPVVATRCGGPEEVLRDGVDSILVPVGGHKEMAAATVELLNNPAKARAYGRAGRAHVSSRFTERQYVQNLERVLQETAANIDPALKHSEQWRA